MGMGKVIAFVCTLFGVSTAHAGADGASILALIAHDYRTSSEASKAIGELAQRLEARGDHRSLFAHIYSHTIHAAQRQLQQGQFENPAWVETLVVNYANIYRRTIRYELSGHRQKLPFSWQLDFSYNQRAKNWAPDLDLVYGISVHISHDLVEALLTTPTRYDSPSIAADFTRISQTLKDTMPEIWAVFSRFGAEERVPSSLAQTLMTTWIARLRARAWDYAVSASRLSPADQQAFLDHIDVTITDQAKHYGLTYPLQPVF
jgi:hypothetical protein